ncbi:MAG: hypothetical protein QOE70_5033 [Chthoniobacter sp.]|jgi:two-component system sensor histidine kinase CpxA|nr:hypothetical protein [Chthoniobacter sp.]
MRLRLPLYARILIWFFLNLVAVAAVVALLFNAQFLFNLDWLLATGARERIEAVRDLIVGELNTTPPDEWHRIVERYSEAYRVRFALLDEEGNQLIGDSTELPNEVRERILARADFPARGRSGEERPTEFRPSEPPPERGSDRGRRWRGPPLRALLRTTNPTRYWLLASARLDNALAGDPMRVILVARSSTLSGGGLVFDARPWVAVGMGAVVFSLLFWLPLVRGITRTVGRMVHTTRQIADGRFDVRVNLRRRDELGSLAESIDQMAARLDGFVTGQKRFLSDIAHELCSPLARLQMALGILEQRAPADQSGYVRSAADKAEQIAALVGELLSFSKASFGATAIQLQPVKVPDAVEEAVRRERTDGMDLRLDIPDDLVVTGNSDLLIRALANLLRNAIQHAGAAGPITIQAARDGDEITISVADSGPGVPEAELPKIFDAFYRLDASRTRDTGGVGLGLAIVKTCLDSCCGTVNARNRQPHGLEVLLHLPAAKESKSSRGKTTDPIPA